MSAPRRHPRLAVCGLAALLALTWSVAGRLTAQSAPPGTARIAGRVVAFGDEAAPVRRAIVLLSGGIARSQSVVTDDEGRFAFVGLPAGTFMLTATRPGFVPAAYGARTPGRPGTPLQLAAGQALGDLTIRMAPGAAIAGTVRDERGMPVPGAQIVVLHAGRRSVAAGTAPGAIDSDVVTDDLGNYRVWGLAPGAYLVGAGRRDAGGTIARPSAQQVDAALAALQQRGRGARPGAGAAAPRADGQMPAYGFAAAYYPGSATLSGAAPVVVAVGDERSGIDLLLAPVATAVIRGRVLNPAGPVPPVQLALHSTNQVTGLPLNFTQPGLAVRAGPDGAFQYNGVLPGAYTITARSMSGSGGRPMQPIPPATEPWIWAGAEVSVAGSDVEVILSLAPAPRVSGRVRFDGAGTPAPPDIGAIQVRLASPSGGTITVVNGVAFGRLPPGPATVRPDGTFEFAGVLPGQYRVSTTSPPGSRWGLRSAMLGGDDLLDTLLTVHPSGGDLIGLTLTLTDRRTELTGMLQTPSGTPATDYVVIAFTTERTFWRPDGRRLASARPATDGRFSMPDLPPGDYYLAALTDLDPDEWQTAEFLDQVVPGAVRVTVADGQPTRQDLRIAR
jgi:hypothetical protein